MLGFEEREPTHKPLDMMAMMELADALSERGRELTAADVEAVAEQEDAPVSHVWAAMGGHPMLSLKREHKVLVYVCVGRCQLWGGVELLESALELKRERAAAGKTDFDLSPHGCLNRCAQAPMAIAQAEDGYVGMERAGVDDVRALLEEIDTLDG